MGERERIREAAIDVVLERGNDGATVEAVVERAGVDRAAFDRHFDDLGDCILQAYRAHTNEFTVRLQAAFDRESSWRDSLRAAAYAAARYMRDNPRIVRFGTLQLFQAGDMAQAERERHLHQMVDLVDAGRQELEDPDSIGRNVAEGVFGSIYELVVKEMQSGRGTRSAEERVPELMYVAVRPYLGHAAAVEELSIPAPPEAPPPDERERIREAVLDLVFEHGCDGTSTEMILERAGVDAAAFERSYGNREDCFLVIYRESNEQFVREVRAAFEAGGAWRDSLRAAAYTGARFLRDRPREVRLNVIQVFRAGEMAMAERDRYHQLLVDLVDAGREELDDPDSVTRGVAEGVVGSIVETMVHRVGKDGSAVNAEAAVPELMYVAVRPYLGQEAALEELSMPPPEGQTDARPNEI